MKALVLEEYNHLVYQDVTDPPMGPNDVLIRVRACGICGSDIHGLDGSSGRRIPPIIMGHEASGVIADVGSAVRDWHAGDRVTFDSTVYCGECYFCTRGSVNLCDRRRVMGVSTGDYRQHGAYAEYVTVPQHILYRLPDNLSFEQATMVETLSIAFHAVGRAPVRLNDTAVVVGAGMVGLLVIQSLGAAGCGTIIAVDISEDRLALAQTLGADETLNSGTDDVVSRVADLTGGRGADLAHEVVGMSETVDLSVSSLRKGGHLVLVGNLSPTVEFAVQSVVTRELTLYGSCSSSGEYPACLDMIARGTINVDALISAVAPLSDGAAWFDRLYGSEPGLLKVVLQP